MKISMKLAYQYIAFFFFNISNHLHPLQVGNCDSNSRLVVDEDDNSQFQLEITSVCRKIGLLPPSQTVKCRRIVFYVIAVQKS